MKYVLIIIIILFLAFFILFFILGYISRSGKTSGLVQGKLSKCPNKPNCVCSEYKEDELHYIDPITITGSITTETLSILKSAIKKAGGTILVESTEYISAVFSSRIFRFKDDLEIRIDRDHNTIHMRSASRVGYGDMGVNKKRTDLVKRLFFENIDTEKRR